MQGQVPAESLRNKVAIIGVTALGLADVVNTPVTAHMDGVEVHAQTLETNRPFMPAFHQGLAQAGYVEGRNVVIAHRWADGDADRRPARSASPSR